MVLKNSFSKKQKNITDNILQDSIAVFMDPSTSDQLVPIGNPAKKPAGNITAFDTESKYTSQETEFAKRQNTSPVLVTVGKDINIDSLVANWNSDFMLSYLAIMPVYYGGYAENSLELIEATDSLNGNILSLLTDVDESYANMDSTTNITLKFKNTFGDTPPGFVREYVLITNGRYENERENDNQLLNQTQNNNNIPMEYKLYQNYPNPFNPNTTIKFDLPRESMVTLKIYNVLGKEIYSLKELKQAGFHKFDFDGNNFSSGVYFYRLESSDFTQTKRMVLIK
ncbi:MAG: T9SS type A sorting domain-containing protein [bacterium]|nr:T9SS type A sorting domain-containing protein [bacterium]